MDRAITRKRFPFKIVAGALILLGAAGFFAYQILVVDKKPTVYAKTGELLLASVSRESFQEYVNVTGVMAPGDSLYIDALEGGQIKELYVEAGDTVKKDDPILLMENTDLEMDELLKEARIIEKEHELQHARVNCVKVRHQLDEALLDLEFRLTRLDKEYGRNRDLAKSRYIAADEFEEIEDSFHYWQKKRDMLMTAIDIEERLNEKTLRQIEAGIHLLRTDHEKTRKRLKDLLLKAPVTGLLTSLDASVGETKNEGERIGQIDLTDQIKVIARVDEYFSGRVNVGNAATLEMYDADADRDMHYDLKVSTISPDVRDNEFEVEFTFARDTPPMVRLGQSFTVRLSLGRRYEALVLKKGPFVQTTGGSWVYVVEKDGGRGVRRNIRIGKHNPDYFEVLDGLSEGEKVIISSYENYEGAAAIELD